MAITCFFENKHKTSLRHVTVDALIVKDNKILLIKRASHLTNANKWAFPGGFLDRDETIRECILREVKEETGFSGEIVELFSINDSPNRRGEDRQNVNFIYLVKIKSQLSQPDNETSQLAWFRLNQLPKKEDFAFDHWESIQLYFRYLKRKQSLPIIS